MVLPTLDSELDSCHRVANIFPAIYILLSVFSSQELGTSGYSFSLDSVTTDSPFCSSFHLSGLPRSRGARSNAQADQHAITTASAGSCIGVKDPQARHSHTGKMCQTCAVQPINVPSLSRPSLMVVLKIAAKELLICSAVTLCPASSRSWGGVSTLQPSGGCSPSPSSWLYPLVN